MSAAIMHIQIVTDAKKAVAELGALERGVSRLGRSQVVAAAGGRAFAASLAVDHLERYGKNLQWVGRQIEFNFTLPIALAAGMATKWALENEAAFVRVEKVYNEVQGDAYSLREELDLLGQAFRILSDIFGVHLDQVNEIGAMWAQAGANGAGLARSVRNSLELMILGEMEAAEATEALIAVQSQYGLNSEELTAVIADLNAIENETATSMSGLIQAMQRGAGAARTAGVDHRHFAAMVASLVPAAGNAEEAGNSLRTLISRVMAPTKQATDMMRNLGLEVDQTAWHSSNFVERMRLLTASLDDVSQSQKNVALSVIGSRWQVSRLSVLIDDLKNAYDGNVETQSRYQKALDATADAEEVMKRYHEELRIFLTSTPQGFKILTTQIRNLATDIIQPLLPAMLGVLSVIKQWLTAFTDLAPKTQTFILLMLVLLAVFGPILRYAGAAILVFEKLSRVFLLGGKAILFLFTGAGKLVSLLAKLLGFKLLSGIFVNAAGKATALGKAFLTLGGWAKTAVLAVASWFWRLPGMVFRGLQVGLVIGFRTLFMGLIRAIPALLGTIGSSIAAALGGISAATLGWIALILAAIVGIIVFFGDEIVAALRWLANNWRRLPEIFRVALQRAIEIVASAVRAIWEWLSYLNPFARHSPSLVDNVKAGVAIIAAEYASLDTIGRNFSNAINNFTRFMNVTASARRQLENLEYAEKKANIAFVAPNALDEVDALILSIRALKAEMFFVQRLIDAQVASVERWERALAMADRRLEAAERTLSVLTDRVNGLNDALSEAEARMQELAQTPIEGMEAYSDAIFENEMAQKRLRLEMLRLEDAGDVVDDVTNRLANLQGELELLRGNRESLRLAGAGSDVLSVIDARIKELEEARSEVMAGAGSGGGGLTEIDRLQAELDKVIRQGEILRLESEIMFDPMLRAIDKAANSMEEMPFDEIISGVKRERAEVERLKVALDAATEAQKRQEAVVDSLRAKRDEIARVLDEEKAALDRLRTAYSELEDQVNSMESALDGFAAAAREAKAAAEAAADAAKKAKAAGVGGGAGAGAGDGIDPFDAAAGGNFEVPGGTAGIGGEGGDIQDLIDEWSQEVQDMFGNFDVFGILREEWDKVVAWAKEKWQGFLDWLGDLDITSIFDGWFEDNPFSGIGDWWSRTWDSITNSDIATRIGEAFDPIYQVIQDVWDDIEVMVGDFIQGIKDEFAEWGDLATPVRNAWNNVYNAVRTFGGMILGWIGAWLQDIWNDIWFGLERVGSMVAQVWEGIWAVVAPIFDLVLGWIENGLQMIRGVIQVFAGLFTLDWELMAEGFRNIWEGMWNNIVLVIETAAEILGNVLLWIIDTIEWAWDEVVATFSWLWDKVQYWWNRIIGWLEDLWWNFYMWLVGGSLIPDMVNEIVGWFEKAWQWIKDVWTKIKNFFYDVWNKIYNWVRDKVTAVYNWIRDKFTAAKNKITEIWNAIRSKASELWNRIYNAVRDKVTQVYNTIREKITNAKNKVSEIWGNIRDAARTWWDRITGAIRSKVEETRRMITDKIYAVRDKIRDTWNSIKSTASSIWNRIVGVVKGAVNNIIEKINKLIRAWNGLSFKAPRVNFPGTNVGVGGGTINTPNIPTIPKVATGGVFDATTLALIAETPRSRPEIVTPERLMRSVFADELDRRDSGQMIMFNGDLVFPNVKDGDDAEAFINNLKTVSAR